MHPTPPNGHDDELALRRDIVRQLGLDQPTSQLDDFARQLAHAADLPCAMVNLFVDHGGGQLFVGLHQPDHGSRLDLGGTPLPAVGRHMSLDHGYCPEVVRRGRPLVLTDVCDYPRFAGNPVVDQLGIRTYAGAPLIHQPSGVVLGTVCVVGTEALPAATGRPTLKLIKEWRDQLMHHLLQDSPATPPP